MFHEHELYMKPIWEGGRIVAETIFPLYKKGQSGELTIALLNEIARVYEVRRADRSETFTEGRDYFVRAGKLVIPANSRIRIMPWEEYNPEEKTERGFTCTEGGYLLFGEGSTFHKLQYEVTYDAAGNVFDGKYRPEASPLLENTRRILEKGELKLAFFGDSITYGANASGLGNIAPYMPIYPKLAAETLEGRGMRVHYYNPSVGGKTSVWGVEVAPRTVGAFAPDLCVIAFGMNDGNGPADPEGRSVRFVGNIKKIIDIVRGANPAAEFILVCTTFPNPLAKQFAGVQQAFEQPVIDLAAKEGCAVLDMTALQRIVMERKEYHHFTGNNINHPSDFMARMYAQGIVAVIGAGNPRG